MPDIAMCLGIGQTDNRSTSSMECPKKETCYRFKAIPNKGRQSYFMFLPYDRATEICKHFMKVTEEDFNRIRTIKESWAEDATSNE